MQRSRAKPGNGMRAIDTDMIVRYSAKVRRPWQRVRQRTASARSVGKPDVGVLTLGASSSRTDKSFLLLFFKKEDLACLLASLLPSFLPSVLDPARRIGFASKQEAP
jgi:hypothetical protein